MASINAVLPIRITVEDLGDQDGMVLPSDESSVDELKAAVINFVHDYLARPADEASLEFGNQEGFSVMVGFDPIEWEEGAGF